MAGMIYDVIESARRERRRARLVLSDSARGFQYILQARFVGGKAWVDLGVVEWKENTNTGAREQFRGFKDEVFHGFHDLKLRARRAG